MVEKKPSGFTSKVYRRLKVFGEIERLAKFLEGLEDSSGGLDDSGSSGER